MTVLDAVSISNTVSYIRVVFFFFFQAEDGIRDDLVTGVQTCALPISAGGGELQLAAEGLDVEQAVGAVRQDHHHPLAGGGVADRLDRVLGAGLRVVRDLHDGGEAAVQDVQVVVVAGSSRRVRPVQHDALLGVGGDQVGLPAVDAGGGRA